ncbi:hypothetical protein [Dactylosporangium sp. NPDC049140]
MQTLYDDWLISREQELQPNTIYNYGRLLNLIYPHIAGSAPPGSAPA